MTWAFRVVVLTRFDSPELDPYALGLLFTLEVPGPASTCHEVSAGNPAGIAAYSLFCYSWTGAGCTGYHYDPLFTSVVATAEPVASSSDSSSESESAR